MSWPKWLSANRVAAIAAFLTSIAAGIGSLEDAFPTSKETIGVVVSVIGAVVVALNFMVGSWKDDRNQANIVIAQATANYIPPADYRPPAALVPEEH